jgi:hypothetical protein
MPSIDSSFQQALANFSKRLTKQELEDFKFSSLSDVLVAVEDIQVGIPFLVLILCFRHRTMFSILLVQYLLILGKVEQGRRKELMNLTRIRRFLEAMDQYGKVIEVFLNASSMLCFVWGPMKFCLQVRLLLTKAV